MAEDSYTIKEFIAHSLNDMREKIKENHDNIDEKLNKILDQTTRTNGRVNSLEKSRVKLWTAMTVFGLLGTTILALAKIVLFEYIHEEAVNAAKSSAELSIQQLENKYNIKIK